MASIIEEWMRQMYPQMNVGGMNYPSALSMVNNTSGVNPSGRSRFVRLWINPAAAGTITAGALSDHEQKMNVMPALSEQPARPSNQRLPHFSGPGGIELEMGPDGQLRPKVDHTKDEHGNPRYSLKYGTRIFKDSQGNYFSSDDDGRPVPYDPVEDAKYDEGSNDAKASPQASVAPTQTPSAPKDFSLTSGTIAQRNPIAPIAISDAELAAQQAARDAQWAARLPQPQTPAAAPAALAPIVPMSPPPFPTGTVPSQQNTQWMPMNLRHDWTGPGPGPAPGGRGAPHAPLPDGKFMPLWIPDRGQGPEPGGRGAPHAPLPNKELMPLYIPNRGPGPAPGANAGIGSPLNSQKQPAQTNAQPTQPAAQPAAQPGVQQSEQGSDAWRWGLLAAGLGILANNKGNYGAAGPALGAGGMQGLQTFLGLKQQEQNNAFRKQQQALYERQVDSQVAAQKDVATMRKQKTDLLERIRLENDPLVRESLVRELALMDDASAVYTADNKQTKDPAIQYRIQALIDAGVPEEVAKGIAAGRYVVSRDPVTGQATILDLASWAQRGGGTPQYSNSTPQPAQQESLPDYSVATGGSGFFGNLANKITDMFGLPLANQSVDEAQKALQALRAQTITMLQDAVPGRPSVYLMEQMEPLTVKPGSLLQGDSSAFNALKSTREILSREVDRMERDILSGKVPVKPDELSKTRASHSQLSMMVKEYDKILSGWKTPTADKDSNAARRDNVEKQLQEIEQEILRRRQGK